MRKKKNTRSPGKLNAADGAVVLICLLGAFFSFWFFWKDLNRALNRNQEPTGIITFKKGGAQRRLGDRVLWDRLRQESPIYDGDYIRTAALSDATVTFKDGRKKKFSLSENSLIQLRTVEGRQVIDLAEGDISMENSGPEPLILVSGGRQVELSGIVKARAGEDGSFELAVLEGQAVISNGEERIVQDAGQVFAVDPEGLRVERPRVVMILPRPDEEFTSPGEKLEVDFSWAPINFSGTEHTRLEIAEDRRFARPLESLETEGPGASVELPPGTYWWRAYVSASGPEGASPEKLTILPAVSSPVVPVIAAPLPAPVPEEIPAEPEPVSPPVPAPKPHPPPAPKKPEPAKPAPQKPPPEQPAPERPRLQAVKALRPENNYRVGPAQIRQSRSLTFSWEEAPGANGYIFTLQEESGKTILSAGPQPETSYTLDLRRTGPGSFVWQVEAVRRNGEIIEERGPAAKNRFTVEIPKPGNPRLQDPGPLYGNSTP
jgi:hypothetical protein